LTKFLKKIKDFRVWSVKVLAIRDVFSKLLLCALIINDIEIAQKWQRTQQFNTRVDKEVFTTGMCVLNYLKLGCPNFFELLCGVQIKPSQK
jgi:hypothetical protein